MEIQIDPHTLERAEERGTNEDEIKDVLHTGFTIPAKHKRKSRAKVYEFKGKRHGKYYEQKRVEVIYTLEDDVIITVTVYVLLWKMEETTLNILYNDKTDLLYIRLDDTKQEVINRRISDDIVLDIGENNKIVGIEILDASKHVSLEKLLPVSYEPAKSST